MNSFNVGPMPSCGDMSMPLDQRECSIGVQNGKRSNSTKSVGANGGVIGATSIADQMVQMLELKVKPMVPMMEQMVPMLEQMVPMDLFIHRS